MELIIIKSIYDIGKKIVTIYEIQEYFKIDNYAKLTQLVKAFIEEGSLSEVRASRSNGMEPPLYNKYRVNPKKEDLSYLEEAINYSFHLGFNREFYLNNLKKYEADKVYIEKLADYFRNNKEELLIPMSINERSFRIWGMEKFLKDGMGEGVVKNLGLSLEDLNVYTTPEPFVYFSSQKDRNQKVLIIENKDTWYTMRKLMIEGKTLFFSEPVDTIIYGSGKNIEKSLEDYEPTVEEYLLKPSRVMYWGDIDYEGIGIYERLKKRYSEKFHLELFKKAYIAMLELSEKMILPISSEKQNKNIADVFLKEMRPYDEKLVRLLEKGVYIPQEIVNYRVLREE